MHVGAPVAEGDEGLGTCVLEVDAFTRAFRGDEDLVGGHLAIADEVGAVDLGLADVAGALYDDEAVGARVLDRHRVAGPDGELTGAEQLFAVDGRVALAVPVPVFGLASGEGIPWQAMNVRQGSVLLGGRLTQVKSG